MEKQYSVGILTLGCKVNQYESEAISEKLEELGFKITSANDVCDAYILNTCTVTAESDRKARQMIRRMLKNNPCAIILITGCYSQVSPEAIATIDGVDYICGSSNKMTVTDKLCELICRGKNPSPEICVPSLESADFECMSIKKFDRTRAYVKIEDGCESKCTYCTIPAARGPIRSKPFNDVINEVRMLTLGGCREVVLTGIETGSYGDDLSNGEDLASLLCEVDKISGIGRVRLGSLDPTVIRPEFVERIKELHSVAPHFHLSLQSGSDNVLAKMKRKYNSARALKSISLLRDAIPNVKFTTDIIVGFPGETDEDFKKSCEFAKEAEFLMIHVFPYSKRRGTLAATMPEQVPEEIKKQRVHILSEISREIKTKILDCEIEQNPITDVLFETYKSGYSFGHTSDFIEVKAKSDSSMHGKIARVKLLSHNGDICEGEIL